MNKKGLTSDTPLYQNLQKQSYETNNFTFILDIFGPVQSWTAILSWLQNPRSFHWFMYPSVSIHSKYAFVNPIANYKVIAGRHV